MRVTRWCNRQAREYCVKNSLRLLRYGRDDMTRDSRCSAETSASRLALPLLFLAWNSHVYAQTAPAAAQAPAGATLQTQQRVSEPEPKESLLTPSVPTPEGDVPLLRRVNLGPEAQRGSLPPFIQDTSVKLHLRVFDFDRTNSDDTENEAWAYGGWLAYHSGWLSESFAVGAVGYTSQRLDASDSDTGTGLLKPPQESISVLGQAYAQLRFRDQALLTGYRQLVEEGYVNGNDTRMIPNTFEGVTLTGQVGRIGYYVGYITDMKRQSDDDFHDMASVAGATGDEDRALILTRLSAQPLAELRLYAANYLTPDVLNTVYANAEYTFKLGDDVSLQAGIQYTEQHSLGDELLGDFSTWNVSTRALLLWRGLTAGAGYALTGDGSAIRSPYGSFPGYLKFMERTFDRANEHAWGAGFKYDFGGGTVIPKLRIPGLTLLLRYAEGHDAKLDATGQLLPNVKEEDLDIIWNVEWIKGLQVRLRQAHIDDGGERSAEALRFIVNYEIPLL
jgi:hypothetical protein